MFHLRKGNNMVDNNKFEERENIVKLYQDISINGFLKIYCRYKNQIDDFNSFIFDKLKNDKGIDIKTDARVVFCEKINKMYNDKQKSFFSLLLVICTILLVLVTYFVS